MLAEQRRQQILEELQKSESISVMHLCEHFGVSDMTIRRDLDALEKRRLLKKVHGGAVRVPQAATELHFSYKRNLQRSEKESIAQEAMPFVKDGDSIALSAGTTTWCIAAALRRTSQNITFVTNSTNIAMTLQDNGWENILLSGGTFRTPSDALVGPYADRVLQSLNVDTLFLGVHGIHPEAGLTTPNIAEAETDRILVETAQSVVVVADHTKVGVTALASIAPLSKVDALITDEYTPEKTIEDLELAGLRVIVAREVPSDSEGTSGYAASGEGIVDE